MPRYLTRGVQALLDIVVLSLGFWLGFGFRFEFSLPDHWATVAVVSWPYVVVLEYGALMLLGVTRNSWRYVSLRDATLVGFAMGASTLVLVTIRFAVGNIDTGMLRFAFLPLGVLGSNFFLGFVGLVVVRAARRVHGEARERKRRAAGRAMSRVLLIGAGQAGVMVAREIASRPDLALHPVGFLDDNRFKTGTNIGGLPVLGTTAQLAEIAGRKRVEKVLITIANASGTDIRRITLACREVGLETKIIPGIYEIVGERVNLSRIREVAIDDLLGREPVQLDEQQIAESIGGETVMVTGAGGSIGSELCRQVCRFSPACIVLVERFENALFEIHRELLATFPLLKIDPRIADVTDAPRMERLFSELRPSTVFHAAAHKHVPMMESNPGEAVKNNVGGTRLVADLSDKYGVERFVMISTDKAVNPTSVMGATKRVAEIYVQSVAQRSKTRFVTVRFGNVLGSNGSVIPIFKEQIARGGPITVTHADMQRYFMTIPEATQLVLQAGAMGGGGEIFILDMGKPVKIVDLARDLISLSGLRLGEDIAIEITGVRPGEKLFEELSMDAEHADKTKHPKIFIGKIEPGDTGTTIADLLQVAASDNHEKIRKALHAVVPMYLGDAVPTNGEIESPRSRERPHTDGDRDRRTNPTGLASITGIP